AGDADAEGVIDEVDEVSAAGVGVCAEEMGDGAGIAGQELAIRAAVHAVMGLLDGLLGGESLLTRSGGPADAEQSRDGSHLESAAAVEEKMAEESVAVVVGALVLSEAEGGLEECPLLEVEACSGQGGLLQPAVKGIGGGRHEGSSWAMLRRIMYSVAGGS